MSERTPLFRPAGAAGFFVPSPLCHNMEMYEFVGRLMAACILSEERLVVILPTLIWKRLAGIPVTLEDYYDAVAKPLLTGSLRVDEIRLDIFKAPFSEQDPLRQGIIYVQICSVR